MRADPPRGMLRSLSLLRLFCQFGFAVQLFVLAQATVGTGSRWLWLLVGLSWCGVGAWRGIHDETTQGWARWGLIAIGGGGAMVLALQSYWDPFAMETLWPQAAIWVLSMLVIGVVLDPSTWAVGRGPQKASTGLALAVVFCLALCVETWQSWAVSLLLGMAGATLLVWRLLSAVERWEIVASRRGRSSLGWGSSISQIGPYALATLLVMTLLSGASFGLFWKVSRAWAPNRGSQDVVGFLPRRDQALGLPGLFQTLQDDRVVATVEQVEPGDTAPRVRYLREHVLDQWSLEDGCWVLGRRTGSASECEDGSDGVVDGRIAVDRQVSIDQVLRVSPLEWGPVLAEPHAGWIETAQITFGVDESWRVADLRPYSVGSNSDAYFGRVADNDRTESLTAEEAVPEAMSERDWLREMAFELLPVSLDEGVAVQRLAQNWQRLGVWQIPPLWNGSYERFLADLTGVCSHFAQTAAVLCRARGIPARIAVGYLAQEYDFANRCYVIRGRHRHAWLEVRFERRGWVAFEVTPSREGNRVAAASSPAKPSPAEDLASATKPMDEVLSPRQWGLWGALALGGLCLLGVAWLPLFRRPTVEGPEVTTVMTTAVAPEVQEAWWRLQRWGNRVGAIRRPGETVRQYLQQLQVVSGVGEAKDWESVTRAYEAARFGVETWTAEDEQRLQRLLYGKRR